MAVTVTNQSTPLGGKIVQDDGAGAVKENTTGGSGTLYMVEIDNASYSTAVYFKMVNAASATIGSTAATMVLYCPASSRRSYAFPKGIAFSTGFTHWCTTGAAESSTTTPSTNPTVWYVTS